VSTKRCTDFVPPDRPGESNCPGCRRLRGFLTRWPPSVTVVDMTGAVNAVTGAVTAVTWGRDPVPEVTGTVPAVIAVAGCHSPSHGRRAISCSPQWGRLLMKRSLARPKLRPFCATRVATLARVDTRGIAVGRVAGNEASRDPEVASSFQNVARPKRPSCRAEVATPPPAPGSRPGGSQAIGSYHKSSDRLHRASTLRDLLCFSILYNIS
jgi:hypothetical protein